MDKQAILNGAYFHLGSNNEDRFRLTFRNWNDYGFYTLYEMWITPKGIDHAYKIADLRIMNIGQKFGEKPGWIPCIPWVFISSTDSAENLFMMLTPEQRKDLEKTLVIRYDCEIVKNETVFNKSVNRDSTIDEFVTKQSRIKALIQSPINMRDMAEHHCEQWSKFIGEFIP